MRIVKIIGWMAIIALVLIQFFPVDRNQSDTVPRTDFMVVNTIPVQIKNQLQVSCYDCHSNNTEYPWYNKIQPVAWYLEGHIKEGKEHLNFNEWGDYSNRRKNSKLKSIIEQIESGEMPMTSYTLIHRDAVLDSVAMKDIINYMNELKQKN